MGRKSDAKQRILDSARELIYASSYANVGVQTICEQAGVKKGSFYHFFSSKQALTLAVLDQLWKFSQEQAAQAFTEQIPPLQRIQHFVAWAYDWQMAVQQDTGVAQGSPYGNLAVELSTQDEVIRQKIAEIFNGIKKQLETALQAAMDEGVLAEDIDVKATAIAMLAYLEGLALLSKTYNKTEMFAQLSYLVLQLQAKHKKN